MHYNFARPHSTVADPIAALSIGSRVVIHDVFFVVVLGLFWIGPAFLVGRLAARKGRSFGVFFVAALLLFWPVVLVVTVVLPARRSISN